MTAVPVTLVINDLTRGGAETQLVELALALDRTRYAPEVVLLKQRNDFAERLAAGGVPATPLRRRGFWDLGVMRRLERHLRARGTRLVHSFLTLANTTTAVAGRRAQVGAVVLSQRCTYEGELAPLPRALARWSHRRADRLIVNARQAAREEEAAGFPAERLVYIPNGVPLPALEPLPPRPADLGARPYVLAMGQLIPRKGFPDLLAAWAQVQPSHADTDLVILGDGPEREALQAGAGPSVRFLGFRSPAGPYQAHARLLVHAAHREGMPNAVLEAMAWGRPVLATAVGGTPELVGEAGLLVPPGDPAALAAALLRLLADPAAAEALGRAARARVAERFSVEAMARATERVYEELLGG